MISMNGGSSESAATGLSTAVGVMPHRISSETTMPSQVRIISPKNSAEWDHLVRGLVDGGKLGQEQTYGGCASEERADHVRRKIRTAARKADVASKVFWKPCPEPGKCKWGKDCTHHVYITLYSMDAGREYKAKQAQRR